MIGRVAHVLARLRDHARGATLLEFGLVAGPLILSIMAIGDLGYQSYLRAVTRGVLEKAARAASVGTLNSTQIETYIDAQMAAINSKNGTTSTIKKSYYNFSRVGKPEKITTDTAPLGSYNVGDCYEDANGNGAYDAAGGSTGLGSADDIVYYEVTVSMPRLFPMAKMLGWSATQSATATTIVRNQPWANQSKPTIKCT
ncbi:MULTISPECIES: TadE/TadG family type IV pilus assembly protein [Sphingobium]|uniref:Pilus biosynthesis protein TadE n=2 Tax=Sphingobium cupriresistens TaxID=1132417 RepID=A0A0J7Y443_9SPHN|nr:MULTISPECIES: pilus assembly protein TadE [Sphingobium]KMS58447.1 pilus biosynthesis protein TadE [Sphingobium cupriresistens LL01]MBJ7377701.1 pilus assembly protein [Sphingobium sp.]RYM11754.1 pilus assembly protein [Sphingobium cupriresistens]